MNNNCQYTDEEIKKLQAELAEKTERVGVLEEVKNMMRGQLKIFSGLKCDCGVPCDCYSWKAMAVDSSATLAKLKALEDSV